MRPIVREFRSVVNGRRGGKTWLGFCLLAALLHVGLGGCGDGSSSPPQGLLRIVLRSPAQGRLIPQRTARFRILVSRGSAVEIDETIELPPGGSTARNYRLSIGTAEVTVEALASDGTVLASQSAEAEIKEGQTTSVTLELQPQSSIFPQLLLTATPATVKTGETVTLEWNATDDDQLVRVAVDTNGDGTLEPVEATGSVQVSFPNPGTFSLRGEAQDRDGLIGRAAVQVEVQPRLGQLEIIIK